MGFCFAVSFYFSCNNKVSICNSVNYRYRVVVATAKVQIFKQITTGCNIAESSSTLLLLPQRYKFSSKSQHRHAGHSNDVVVVATAKVQIFKQITTNIANLKGGGMLLLLPQRYKFSSKSQPQQAANPENVVVVATAKVQIFKKITTQRAACRNRVCCCCYRKGTNFQANHNRKRLFRA